MKKIVAFAFLAFFAGSIHAQDSTQQTLEAPPQGWYQQHSGTTAYLPTIFFVDKDTGWVTAASGGATGLYGTVDGGSTWVLINPQPTYNLRFVDGRNGYVALDTGLMRTFDQGKTGTPLHAPIGGQLQIFGMDTIRIFNSGGPAFAGSNDGGQTWFKDDTSLGIHQAQEGNMSFSNSQIGFVCGAQVSWYGPPPPQHGTNGAGFAMTIDGGKTWHKKYCPIQEDLTVIFAINTKDIFVGGDANISISSDNGSSWKKSFSGGAFYYLYFLNEQKGYAVGYGGKIIFTNDSGKTWVGQNSGVTKSLYDVKFTDTLNGWACGDSGTIIHTINGGKSWVKQFLPLDSVIVQNYPEPATSTNVNLHYTIPSPEHVTIILYDATGRLMRTILQNEFQFQGEHTIQVDIAKLSAGSYLYKFMTERYMTSGVITKIVP